MKNKVLVYIFRIVVILAAVLGAMYVVRFFMLGSEVATISTDEAYNKLGTWSMIFFVYLILCCVGAVLSIAAFKTTGKICSVMRTAVLIFAALTDLLSYKYITIFGSIEKAIEAIDKFQDIEDNGFTFIALSFIGAILMLILAITSIAAIIKTKNE